LKVALGRSTALHFSRIGGVVATDIDRPALDCPELFDNLCLVLGQRFGQWG
jgi:hypothetical protein